MIKAYLPDKRIPVLYCKQIDLSKSADVALKQTVRKHRNADPTWTSTRSCHLYSAVSQSLTFPELVCLCSVSTSESFASTIRISVLSGGKFHPRVKLADSEHSHRDTAYNYS